MGDTFSVDDLYRKKKDHADNGGARRFIKGDPLRLLRTRVTCTGLRLVRKLVAYICNFFF